eukprot:6799250-Pyramimonas_sp.AAC.1
MCIRDRPRASYVITARAVEGPRFLGFDEGTSEIGNTITSLNRSSEVPTSCNRRGEYCLADYALIPGVEERAHIYDT